MTTVEPSIKSTGKDINNVDLIQTLEITGENTNNIDNLANLPTKTTGSQIIIDTSGPSTTEKN